MGYQESRANLGPIPGDPVLHQALPLSPGNNPLPGDTFDSSSCWALTTRELGVGVATELGGVLSHAPEASSQWMRDPERGTGPAGREMSRAQLLPRDLCVDALWAREGDARGGLGLGQEVSSSHAAADAQCASWGSSTIGSPRTVPVPPQHKPALPTLDSR